MTSEKSWRIIVKEIKGNYYVVEVVDYSPVFGICYVGEELKERKKTEEMVDDLLEKYRTGNNYVAGDIKKIINTIKMAECLIKADFDYIGEPTIEKRIESYIKKNYMYAEEGAKTIDEIYRELRGSRIIINEMKITKVKEMIVKLKMKNTKGEELYSKRWQHEGVRHSAGLRIKPRVQESDSENESDAE